MNILFVSEYFIPLIHGGAEISAANLVSGLSKKGLSIFVIVPNIWDRTTSGNIKIKTFPFPFKVKNIHEILPNWVFFNPLYWLWQAYWLIRYIKSEKADLIHAQSRNSIPGAVLAAKICNKPVVATFRDWQILCNYGACISHEDRISCDLWRYFSEDFRTYYQDKVASNNPFVFFQQLLFASYNRFILYFLQIFVRKLDGSICISDFQKNVYEINGFKKIRRIYNIEKILTNNFISKKKNIVFGGRATSGKGLPLLLEAFKSALRQDNTLKLLIVGGKDESFVKLAKKLGVDDSVQFSGWVDHADMDEIYANALAIVQPSVFQEPFGRMALEGLAHGIPVVVTRSGGLPEIVNDGITGYVVEPTPSNLAAGLLNVCVNNGMLRKNIKSNLSELINKFEVEPIKMHMNLYKSLL